MVSAFHSGLSSLGVKHFLAIQARVLILAWARYFVSIVPSLSSARSVNGYKNS